MAFCAEGNRPATQPCPVVGTGPNVTSAAEPAPIIVPPENVTEPLASTRPSPGGVPVGGPCRMTVPPEKVIDPLESMVSIDESRTTVPPAMVTWAFCETAYSSSPGSLALMASSRAVTRTSPPRIVTRVASMPS